MSVLADLVVKLSANTTALEKGLKGAKGSMSKLTGFLKAGGVAGGAALAGLGVASLKMGMDFEKTMAEVKTLMPDISEKAFGKMKDDVLAFSKEMGVATDKAVPALYQAISAGIPRENVMEFMRVASKAAIGGVTELETAVDGITSVINAYGVQNISAAKAADIMFTGVRLGKTTFEELSASLFNVVPMAAAAGVGFEEVTAAIARLTAQGVPTAQATTQLREAIKALAAPTQAQAKLMEELGLDFSASRLESIGLAGAFDELYTATGGNLERMRELVGSSEALMAVLGLSGEQAAAFTDVIAETEEAIGGLDEAFETVSETTAFKLNKAINALKVEMTKLGSEVLPKLVDFYERHLIPAVDEIKQAFDDWVVAMGPTIEDVRELKDAAEGLAKALDNLDISFGKSEGEMTNFLARNTVIRMQVGMLTEVMEAYTALLEGRWTDAFKNFGQAALVPFQVAWETSRGTVATVMVGMGKAVEWGINAIIDLLNDFTGALNWVSEGIKKFSFGKIDPGTIGSIEKVTLRLGDLESMLRGSTDAMRNLGLEAGTVDMILQRMGAGLAGGDGGGPGVDGGGGDGGGGGGGAGALAQAVDILTPGMAALNAEVEREEVLLVNIAKALTTATTQHDMITEAITTTEKALNDAERAMSDWENAVLKGTRAFSDMAFGISQDMDRLQLKMNEISLGVLEEGLEEGGYASDALERKIRKLADTFGVELFGGALDWGDIQKVLDAAGIAMEKLSLESRNVNLRENLSLGPKQRELDQFFEDQAGYAESTLPEIKEGWLKAKDQADKLVGSLDDWNAALIINEIHMTFLQGLLDNHRAYLTDIRDLYIDIERAAQDAWSAAAQLPAGTSVTPALPIPVYHQGGYVPRTGPAMLRAGETVIPPGGGSSGDTHVHFDGPLTGDRRQLEDLARRLDPYLQRRRR